MPPSRDTEARAYTLIVAAAVFSQLKHWARFNPASRNCSRALSSAATADLARLSDLTSSGSTITAASPTTSPSDPRVELITGQPQAIASIGGKPKPSNKDG